MWRTRRSRIELSAEYVIAKASCGRCILWQVFMGRPNDPTAERCTNGAALSYFHRVSCIADAYRRGERCNRVFSSDPRTSRGSALERSNLSHAAEALSASQRGGSSEGTRLRLRRIHDSGHGLLSVRQ